MKRTPLITSILTLLALLPAVNAHADSGLLFGASIGSSTLEEDFSGTQLDADATAYRIVGGFQFSDILGIEAGFQDFGSIGETIDIGPVPSRTRISATGWTLGGTLALPLSDRLSLLGRGGVFFWDADVRVDGFSIDVPGNENPYYGGGAKLKVSPNFSLIGDWTRFELDEINNDVISIGFQYQFGG